MNCDLALKRKSQIFSIIISLLGNLGFERPNHFFLLISIMRAFFVKPNHIFSRRKPHFLGIIIWITFFSFFVWFICFFHTFLNSVSHDCLHCTARRPRVRVESKNFKRPRSYGRFEQVQKFSPSAQTALVGVFVCSFCFQKMRKIPKRRKR